MRGSKSKSPPQPAGQAAGRAGARKEKAARAPAAAVVDHGTSNVLGEYSVNALSAMLGHDRRTIDKAVKNVQPTRVEGKTKLYRLADVEAAFKDRNQSHLRDKKLAQEIRKLRIANDREDRLVVPKTKVIDSIRRCLSPAAAALEQRLVNEYPTAVAGLDVPQARIYGKRLYDEVLEFFRSLEKEWTI